MKTVILAAILLAACSHDELESSEPAAALTPPKDAITKVTDHGPVKATVMVWPPKPSLGDPIYVRLEIDSAPGSTVEAPFQEAGEQTMGRFHVLAFARDTRHTADGHQIEDQTYTLDAPASGRERIPPFRMTVAAPKTTDEVLTEEVQLEVAPVKQEAIDANMRPAAGPLDPDVGDRPWWIVGLVGAVLVVGSGSVLLLRWWRTRRQIQIKKSAYEDAVAQLRALEDRGAPTSELADVWFVELSAIVRRYLELRYDIRAPELTTEEFLLVASRAASLTAEHRTLLTAFLERCDRVKFAGYRPDAHESLATLNAARGFVEDTRLREQPIPAARKVA